MYFKLWPQVLRVTYVLKARSSICVLIIKETISNHFLVHLRWLFLKKLIQFIISGLEVSLKTSVKIILRKQNHHFSKQPPFLRRFSAHFLPVVEWIKDAAKNQPGQGWKLIFDFSMCFRNRKKWGIFNVIIRHLTFGKCKFHMPNLLSPDFLLQ